MKIPVSPLIIATLLCVLRLQPLPAQTQEKPTKQLIVYFSWSGNTEKVAAALQKAVGGKPVRIEPQTPYPENYMETVLRARAEKNAIYERNDYPAIRTRLDDMEAYDTVFICYPLWLGKVAMPMQTFLHNHREMLKGKTVIPVCSSGKSPASKTLPDLKRLCPSCIVSGLFSIKREEMEKVEEVVAGWVKDLCRHKAGIAWEGSTAPADIRQDSCLKVGH